MKNNVTSFVIIDRLEGTDFFIVTHQRNKSWMVVNRTFRDLLLLLDGTRSIDEIVALMGPRFKEKDFAKFLTVLQKNLGIAYENGIFASRTIYEKTDILYQKPSSIYIELTNKCNLSCKYCYLSGNLKNSRMLSLDLCKKLLSDVGSNWNPTEIKFVLSGGEPLLHKDLGKIIALLSEYNAPIVVMTNGTLITDDYVKLFARYNVALEISLDLNRIRCATYTSSNVC